MALKKFYAIPQDTFKSMELETGMLLKKLNIEAMEEPADEDIICATTNGITIDVVPTYADNGSGVDNCPNNMMELKEVTGWDCTIKTTMLGTSPEVIRRALGVAEVNGNKITPRSYIKLTDFQDIYWAGDKANGGAVVAHLFNALSTSGLSLQTSKGGTGKISVTFTGHVSIKNQNVMPIEFYSTDPPTDAEGVSAVNESDSMTGDEEAT